MIRRIVTISVISALLVGGSTATLMAKQDTFELLGLLGDVFERIRQDYVEEVDDSDLIEAAINGMLVSLDPHSGYLNKKSFKEMQVQTRGEFGGLGIEVTMENGLVKVVSPIDDTPAARAGIQPGDYVSFIDDEPVMGLTLGEAVEKMRGKVDSSVRLTILRESSPEPIEVTIVRDVIRIKSAKARAEGDDIAYLRVTSFTEKSTDLLRDEFKKVSKDMKNLRGVILDLRNNPGGLLDQAVSISDAFLAQGEIVSTRERDPNQTRRYTAHRGDELIDESVPMVVLINGGSASASEIVSGALQDHKRAVIMGTKSFGKGSVQTVIPLNNQGAIRLTTARYYTPSGHSIQAKGIEPDIEVMQAKIEVIENDKLRKEADLRRRLENLEDKKSRSTEKKNYNEDKELDTSASLQEMKPSEDFQLQRALDLLRAVNVYQQTSGGQ